MKKLLLLNALLLCSAYAKKEKTKKEEKSIHRKDQKSKKDKTGKNNEQLKAKVTQELIDGFQKIKEESAKDKSFDKEIALIEFLFNSSLVFNYEKTDWDDKQLACDVSDSKLVELQKQEVEKNMARAPFTAMEQVAILNSANKDFNYVIIEYIANDIEKTLEEMKKLNFFNGKLSSMEEKIIIDSFALDALKSRLYSTFILLTLTNNRNTIKKPAFNNASDYGKTLQDTLRGTHEAWIAPIVFPVNKNLSLEDIKDNIQSLIVLKDSKAIKEMQTLTLPEAIHNIFKAPLDTLDNIKNTFHEDIKSEFLQRIYESKLCHYTLPEIIAALKEEKSTACLSMARYIEEKIKNDTEGKLEKSQEWAMKMAKNKEFILFLPFIFKNAWRNYIIEATINRPENIKFKGKEDDIEQYFKENNFWAEDLVKYTTLIVSKLQCYLSEHKGKK